MMNAQATLRRALRGPGKPRTCTLDETVFDTITPESAYWIGFLMADGDVRHHRDGYTSYVRLRLSEQDRQHVEAFRTFCRSSHKLTCVETDTRGTARPVYGVTFSSKHMVGALARFGIVPNKSKTAEVLGGLEFNRDFWRGVVDGDGSLNLQRTGWMKQYASIRLYGSAQLLRQFSAFVQSVAPTWQGSVRPHRSIWSVSICGNVAVRVIDVLYRHSAVALDRKREHANQILAAALEGNLHDTPARASTANRRQALVED